MDSKITHGLRAAWLRTSSTSPVAIPSKFAAMRSPTLAIRNEIFQNDTFRKMHLEMAAGPEVGILHSVVFPRHEYDLPILGIDIVTLRGKVTMCIADTSPVTEDLTLPTTYVDGVRGLQATHGLQRFPRRDIPEWGKQIFSGLVVMLDHPESVDSFVEYALALTAFHMDYASRAKPDPRSLDRIAACQLRYCTRQLSNTRTRTMLSRAYSPEIADEYMQTMMFPSV